MICSADFTKIIILSKRRTNRGLCPPLVFYDYFSALVAFASFVGAFVSFSPGDKTV